MEPKHDLGEVRELIRQYKDAGDGVWFPARTRSIDYVIAVFQCGEREAVEIILEAIGRLELSDFHRQVPVEFLDGLICDEYGLEDYLAHNWYIKFAVESDCGARCLTELSCHPTEKGMTLNNGRKLSVTLPEKYWPKRRRNRKKR